MPSRDSERQAFPDDSFEIFEIRGPGNLCGGDFGCETLSRAFGLEGDVIISAFVVGGMLFLFAEIGAVSLEGHTPIEALLFGALISAVDPVAKGRTAHQ